MFIHRKNFGDLFLFHMSDRLILYAEREVGVQIDPGHMTKGTFMLTRMFNQLFFEWLPTDKIVILDKETPPNDFHLVFRLCEVVQIAKSDQTLTHISLTFLLEDSWKLPTFHFLSSHGLASVAHLFAFLFSKGIMEKAEKHTYYINLNYTPFKEVLKNVISPEELIFITEHIKIMKNFGKQTIVRNNPINLEEFKAKIKDFGNLKKEIGNRGVADDSRWYIWPFLMGVFDPTKSYEENCKNLQTQNSEYPKILTSFQQNLIDEQIKEVDSATRLPTNIMKDVR